MRNDIMGCPEISYEQMCRELDRIMSDKPNTNFDISFDDVSATANSSLLLE